MVRYTAKNKKDFIVRTAVENDAAKVIEYATLVFASTDQVLTTSAEFNMSTEDEKAWIKSFDNSANSLLLVAENAGNTIIGMLFFTGHQKIKAAHTGAFGLTVHPDWRGEGIGRTLLLELLLWAKHNETIEKIVLQVFSTNTIAIDLYSSLGFIEEGRHIKAIKQLTGAYADIIQMYLWVQ